MIDVLIVGQGLAGTLLAYFLKKAGKSVKIIDDGHLSSSSTVAAGFINPVTGRKYTKSWMIDDLIPFAIKTYDHLGSLLGNQLYHKRNIIRTIPDIRSENNWFARMVDQAYSKYLVEQPDLDSFREVIFPPFTFGEITQSMQVDLNSLLIGYKKKYCTDILQETFSFQELKLNNDSNIIRYRDIESRNIVFCEGYKGKDNPYFGYLPFEGAKGEVLIIKIPGFKTDKILRHKIFIAPLGDEHYWVGAGYAWDLDNIAISEKERLRLEILLGKILKVPYQVNDHKVGVRPSTKDRRPFLGVHPIHDNMYIFNGLGTKGSSLGPYWANEMANFIVQKKDLDASVDILRYANLFT